jgi:hypothetical protein
MTTKQVAAKVRKHLEMARDGADRGEVTTFSFESESDYMLRLPKGLRFYVRATKAGVNISIADQGYVDAVTGGDRESWSRKLGEPVVEMLKEYEQRVWGTQLGSVEWGDILISVTNVGVYERGEEQGR